MEAIEKICFLTLRQASVHPCFHIVLDSTKVHLIMPTRTKEEAENNGVEVGVDGNQKIDSMMHKPESQEEGKEEAKDDVKQSAKREKIDDDGEDQKEERPAKSAKKDEGDTATSKEGDAAKASKPADKKQAAILDPGKKNDIQGDQEGEFKVLERGQ